MIELKNIQKVYRTRHETLHVLQDISLTIPDHGLVMLLGESGSGKSTLCNILGLLDNLTSGEYIWNGISMHTLSQSRRTGFRREQISFVFQNFNLIPTMTAFENIELPLGYRNYSKSERTVMVENALCAVGLTQRAKHLPDELSGGEQQRIALARALVMNPSLFIADEPTGNLDKNTTKDIMNILLEAGKEKTVFMVTHDEELTMYADQIIWMKNGKLYNVY